MSIFVPTEEQKALLDANVSALVIAGPGTGKTRTAIEKARLTVNTLPSESHKVLFLSFSNAAVFRLAESAKAELTRTERKRISFRTYHAFAAEILRSYGRFVGIPPIFRIMDTLEEKLLLIEEGVSPSRERYQEFLYKKAREGLLAFATLIPLATRLLTSSERLRRIVGRNYPLIIVDEFQDTSEEQWQFLRVVGQYSQVVAFGDPNQIIYGGMHEATEKRMDEFRDWKGVVPVTFSERHFRFGSPEILVFAEALLKGKKYHSKDDSGVYLYDLEFRTKDRHRLRTALALIRWESREQAFSTPRCGNRGRDTLTAALRHKKGRSEELLRALRYERALVYEDLGQHRRSRSELEKLYAEAPDYEDVAVRLGL